MKILIFDTETTELLNNKTKDTCRIIQLSWVNFDTETKEEEQNDFILNTECEIRNTHIHGISTEESKIGYNFSEIIGIFMKDVRNSDLLVAHNINYDLNALEVELFRLEHFEDIDFLFQQQLYDTMIMSCKLLNIKKYIKLTDLYFRFFNDTFKAHNALFDVKATLKCFIYLKSLEIIDKSLVK